MKPTSIFVNITSENPERLRAFYRDVVGLAPKPEQGEGAFDLGSDAAGFGIDGHSEVNGPAKEPARILISFFVEDIAAEEQRLEGKGVRFIRKQGQEFWGGVISTFVDPDGNYCQMIEYRADAAYPEGSMPAAATA